jgi:hypothetical protein
MPVQRIHDDAYLLKIRELFTSIYLGDLEFALSLESSNICDNAFFIRTVNYTNCILPWIESVFPLAGSSVL